MVINLQEKKIKTGNNKSIKRMNRQGNTKRKKDKVVDFLVTVPSKSKMATILP
jgi:hypothetical protein